MTIFRKSSTISYVCFRVASHVSWLFLTVLLCDSPRIYAVTSTIRSGLLPSADGRQCYEIVYNQFNPQAVKLMTWQGTSAGTLLAESALPIAMANGHVIRVVGFDLLPGISGFALSLWAVPFGGSRPGKDAFILSHAFDMQGRPVDYFNIDNKSKSSQLLKDPLLNAQETTVANTRVTSDMISAIVETPDVLENSTRKLNGLVMTRTGVDHLRLGMTSAHVLAQDISFANNLARIRLLIADNNLSLTALEFLQTKDHPSIASIEPREASITRKVNLASLFSSAPEPDAHLWHDYTEARNPIIGGYFGNGRVFVVDRFHGLVSYFDPFSEHIASEAILRKLPRRHQMYGVEFPKNPDAYIKPTSDGNLHLITTSSNGNYSIRKLSPNTATGGTLPMPTVAGRLPYESCLLIAN